MTVQAIIVRSDRVASQVVGKGPRGNVGPIGPGTDLTVQWDANGAVGDGSTNDTADIQAADTTAAASYGRTRANKKTYGVSGVTVSANVNIETAGLGTTLKQLPGTADGTVILRAAGSGVDVGDLSLTGQIATNTGEQNHGAVAQANGTVGDLSQIVFGNLNGSNLRGDVLYTGTTAGHSLSQASAGHVRGSNILRNLVSVVGGEAIDIKSIVATGGNGFQVFDIETNIGGGAVWSVDIGAAKGQYASCVPPTAADKAEAIRIGALWLDPSLGSDTTPAYGASRSDGFSIRNTQDMQIGSLIANGFNGQAIQGIWNVGELAIQNLAVGYAKLTDCAKTDTTYFSYIQGQAGHLNFNFDILEADLTGKTSSHSAINGADNPFVGIAYPTLVSAAKFISNSNDAFVRNLQNQNSLGIIFSSGARPKLFGGSFTCERLFSNTTYANAFGVDVTASVGAIVNDNNAALWNSKVNGTGYVLFTSTIVWTWAGTLTTPGVITGAGLRSNSASVANGYSTGAGGTSVQTTSKSTAPPALNRPSGKVTTHNAALAAGASISFTMPNSLATVNMRVSASIEGTGITDVANYSVRGGVPSGGGSIRFTLKNESGGSLGEAVPINFTLEQIATS